MEVNEEIIKKIFTIAKMPTPDEITDETLLNALLTIKTQNEMAILENTKEENQNEKLTSTNMPATNNVLVVDDIGVVTYQLKILLQKIGYNVYTAKDIFGALNTFAKTKYDIIIMDLFVSTEQEGYTLLAETKKIITQNNLPTKIIIITGSSKTENKVKCLNAGADIFIKKELGWQDKLVEIIENFKFGN